jgi:hypothetical protein
MTEIESPELWVLRFVERNGVDKPVLRVLGTLADNLTGLSVDQIKLLQKEIPLMIESALKWDETETSRS